jgi:hypothetical protein
MSSDRESPIWLTNGLMENTRSWSPAQFDRLGLGYQLVLPLPYQGPYPLTVEEGRLVSLDEVAFTPAGGCMSFGYSVLYMEEKWLAPSIEYSYQTDGKPPPALRHSVEEEGARLARTFAELRAVVLLEPEPPEDRLVLDLLVPFPVVLRRFASFEEWLAYCKAKVWER